MLNVVKSINEPAAASLILALKSLAGDILMKLDTKKQIPNWAVYLVLYAVLFGISGWLLVFHSESPTNWLLYVAMIVSISAGLVKFAVHMRKRQPESA